MSVPSASRQTSSRIFSQISFTFADLSNEAETLKLSITKAKHKLGWKPRYRVKEALQLTVDWYKEWLNTGDMNTITLNQINKYMENSGY